MSSANELFRINREHSKINLPPTEQNQALETIRLIFLSEVTIELFTLGKKFWLETVREPILKPNHPTLFDGGDRTFDRSRSLRWAGNLLASCNRLFTTEHRNPVGFHNTMHWLGQLKDAIEFNQRLPVSELLATDSSNGDDTVLDTTENNRSRLLARITAAKNLLPAPLANEELHGLRRGIFRDLMHAYQLLAMATTINDPGNLLPLAAYQYLREDYDWLDKTRKATPVFPTRLPLGKRDQLAVTLEVINSALS